MAVAWVDVKQLTRAARERFGRGKLVVKGASIREGAVTMSCLGKRGLAGCGHGAARGARPAQPPTDQPTLAFAAPVQVEELK